ncbi:MAG: EamA family transporter [Vicinamibacterales bacterium]
MSTPTRLRSDPARARAYGAWIVVCLVWGTTYLAIRIALETMPPMLMAGIRWVSAGILLLAGLAVRRIPLPPLSSWPALALIGGLMTSIGNGAVVWAEQTVPSGLAALLVAAVPFWMVGVERLMPDHEPVTLLRIAGLLVGFSGIVLLVGPDLFQRTGNSILAGAAATQLACIGWSIGSSYSRRRHTNENVIASAAIQMLFGGGLLLIAGGVLGEWPALSLNSRTLIATTYLVLAGSIAAFTAYLYALRHLPVATVSMYAYINPVIAVALGTAILGEPFSPRLAVAGAVVLVGMMMVRRSQARPT